MKRAVDGGLLLLALLVPRLAVAQDPVPAPPRTGVIAGVIRDVAGLPLGDARISVDSGAYVAFSAADGRYRIERVAVGAHAIEARKTGYRPTAGRVTVSPDTLITVNIRLTKDTRLLPQVLIQADPVSSVSGVVRDTSGSPLAGVVVEAMGFGERTESDAEGRFLLSGLKPRIYLLQWRKPGYAVAQQSIAMEPKLQQRYEVTLGPAEANLITGAELAAIVAQEATRRIGMKGARAVIVGREELDRFGSTPLDAALRESSAAIAMREVRQSCAMLDGHQPLAPGGRAEIVSSGGRSRGPTSILTEVRAVEQRASRNSLPDAPALAPSANWVGHFRADEVEMVEVYPEGSEYSQTLCGRFPPSSGCSCPPPASGIVIWLRK